MKEPGRALIPVRPTIISRKIIGELTGPEKGRIVFRAKGATRKSMAPTKMPATTEAHWVINYGVLTAGNFQLDNGFHHNDLCQLFVRMVCDAVCDQEA
jgi:hypothetical protein